MQKETWKDVIGYEGLYMVSNKGKVKSLDRMVSNGHVIYHKKGTILKPSNCEGYNRVILSVNGNKKYILIHQLVAQSFLNHTVCGLKLVVNHIDFNRRNNNVDNLEIITNRENCNRNHLKSTSKYTGVSWDASKDKWCASLHYKGKSKHIGYYFDEFKAHIAYELFISKINH